MLIVEKVVSGAIFFYQFLIFIRVLLTWVILGLCFLLESQSIKISQVWFY